MKALLIIDMQLGSFKPYTLRHDTMGVIERLNGMAQHFRSNGHKVIYIQHDGTREHSFLSGSDDWKILPELIVLPGDPVVSKTANDSFYKTDLEAILTVYNITELYCSGCATDFCVDTTIKSAHSKEYKVTVIEDGHTTASRPGIDAPSVIRYYNWLWADMTPTKHQINVLKSIDVIKELGR